MLLECPRQLLRDPGCQHRPHSLPEHSHPARPFCFEVRPRTDRVSFLHPTSYLSSTQTSEGPLRFSWPRSVQGPQGSLADLAAGHGMKKFHCPAWGGVSPLQSLSSKEEPTSAQRCHLIRLLSVPSLSFALCHGAHFPASKDLNSFGNVLFPLLSLSLPLFSFPFDSLFLFSHQMPLPFRKSVYAILYSTAQAPYF